MKIDRSKLKKTSLNDIAEVERRASATMGSANGWTQFVTLVEGENIFRILPSIKGICYAPLKTSKLKVEVPTYDENGNKTGTEIKEKNVFCADIHGAKVLNGKDPIVTYINYVQKKAEDEIQDAEERKKYLFPITGGWQKKSWQFGAAPMLSYVAYVIPYGTNDIRKLQLRPAWLKRMKEISVEQSDEDDDSGALSYDCFSGADDGYPLRIMVKKENSKKSYSLSAVLPKKGESWDDFFEANAVTDEQLEELSELASLSDLYVNVYSTKDFKMAIDGLKRLDEEVGYDIFADDAFLNELDEMAALLPDDDDEEEVQKPKKPSRKPAAKQQEEDGTPKRTVKKETISKGETKTYPPLIKLRAFLEDYIESEYEGTESLPDLSIVELREWYDLAKAGKMLPFDEYKGDPDGLPFDEGEEDEGDESTSDNQADEDDESPIDAKPEEKPSSLESTRDRLRNLRNRLTKK